MYGFRLASCVLVGEGLALIGCTFPVSLGERKIALIVAARVLALLRPSRARAGLEKGLRRSVGNRLRLPEEKGHHLFRSFAKSKLSGLNSLESACERELRPMDKRLALREGFWPAPC